MQYSNNIALIIEIQGFSTLLSPQAVTDSI